MIIYFILFIVGVKCSDVYRHLRVIAGDYVNVNNLYSTEFSSKEFTNRLHKDMYSCLLHLCKSLRSDTGITSIHQCLSRTTFQ